MSKRTILIALFFAGASILLVFATRGEEIYMPRVETIYDVTYARPDQVSVKLDIAWPEQGGPYPVIVYFHGGAWAIGDKAMFRHRMMTLARTGYVVFNANYRLAPRHQFPAQVNDAMGAVIFAKEKASLYNGDPCRVAVMGDSAGAHLSAMVTLAWDDPFFEPSYQGEEGITPEVQAAVLMYGGYRLKDIADLDPVLWGVVITRPMVTTFLGGPPEALPEIYAKASPASYLDRDDIPPVMIVCGTADGVFFESEWLHEQLDSKGSPNTAFFVIGAQHEFNYLENRRDFPYLRAILDFLDRELKHNEKSPVVNSDSEP